MALYPTDRTLKALSLMLSYPTARASGGHARDRWRAGRRQSADGRRAARPAPAGRGAGRGRHLRPARALRDALRPLAHAVAQPLRTCPWRKPRPRRRDGRPARDLPRRRVRAGDVRTARPPAGAAGIPRHPARSRGAGDAGRCRAYLRGARRPPRPAREPLCRRLRRAAAAFGRRGRPRARWPRCSPGPRTTRPTSPRSTRSGRRPRSPSAPTRTPAARRCATCSRAWTPPSIPRRPPGTRPSSGGSDEQLPLRHLSLHRPQRADLRLDRPLRARSLHLEELVEPVAAPQAAGGRLDPVPCRRADHLLSAISSAC